MFLNYTVPVYAFTPFFTNSWQLEPATYCMDVCRPFHLGTRAGALDTVVRTGA